MNSSHHALKHPTGFSLIEMMTVIAIIGVLAAVAIPQAGSINQSAKDARDQRNAQYLVTVYKLGAAAGITWVGTTRNTKIDSVIGGQTVVGGAFAGKTFQVSLSGADKTQCYKFIGVDAAGDLVYDQAGHQSSS